MSHYRFKNPLYHGSRGGIVGDIQPISRERCDFGRGFYMGTNSDQAKSLVASDAEPYLYTLSLQIDNFKSEQVLELVGEDWAYFTLFNRGRLESVKGTEFYSYYQHLADGKTLIIGPIADDMMNEVMRNFVNGNITDKVLIESLKAIDMGLQYVVKTEEACQNIQILKERPLYGKELEDALWLANERRKEGAVQARTIQRKFRREGRYLDEILLDARQTSIEKESAR